MAMTPLRADTILAIVSFLCSCTVHIAAKKFRGLRLDENGPYEYLLSPLPHEDPIVLSGLPSAWDWRNVNGVDYTSPVKNQHQPGPKYCGVCYAFGTTTALNARFNIAMGNRIRVDLNVQVLVTCGPAMPRACEDGSDPNLALKFIHEYGLPDESCHTYEAKSLVCDAYAICQDCMDNLDPVCWARKHFPIFRIKEYGSIAPKGNISIEDPLKRQPIIDDMVQRMKAEIWKRGPISCVIACPDPPVPAKTPWPKATNLSYGSFRGYMDDYTPLFNDIGENFPPFILHDKDFKCVGGDWMKCVDHVVTVVGWGVEDGVPYWIMQNSWGRWWGEGGFFRVVMGENNLGVEAGCWFGVPDTDGMTTDSNGFQHFHTGTSKIYADRFHKATLHPDTGVEVVIM